MDGFLDTDIDLAALEAQTGLADISRADVPDPDILEAAELSAGLEASLQDFWLSQGGDHTPGNFTLNAAASEWAQDFFAAPPDAAAPDSTPATNTKRLFTDPPPDDEVISDGTIITVPGGGDLSDFGSTGSIANTQYDGDAPSADALPGDDDIDEVIVRGVRANNHSFPEVIVTILNPDGSLEREARVIFTSGQEITENDDGEMIEDWENQVIDALYQHFQIAYDVEFNENDGNFYAAPLVG